jgi:hypothetical protein
MADNLPPSSADVTESGSLNLPEHSGPHRPVMGLLYLLTCTCFEQTYCSSSGGTVYTAIGMCHAFMFMWNSDPASSQPTSFCFL